MQVLLKSLSFLINKNNLFFYVPGLMDVRPVFYILGLCHQDYGS